MFKLIESENRFVGKTKYGHSLSCEYADHIDPRGVYALIYEIRKDGKAFETKVAKKFTGEQLIFNHLSSKEFILDWYDEKGSETDRETYLSKFVQNLLVMSCYPTIMGKSKETNRLLENITGSNDYVINRIANDIDYINEIIACFLYMNLEREYNSLHLVDHLLDINKENGCQEFLDNFTPSHVTLKNRSLNGSLQFKGASGFLECIPFNADFAPQKEAA